MRNLEQIRARNALAASKEAARDIRGKFNGDVIRKIPNLVMNHGLLATGAYAFSNEGYLVAFNFIARHLADKDIAIVPSLIKTCADLLGYLSEEADSQTLKLATAETMAWLVYAKRFVKAARNQEQS